MKNFAAKLFLIVMAVTALSAAAMAKTAGYDSIVFTDVAYGETLRSSFVEPTDGAFINSVSSQQTRCFIEWVDKKRGKVRLQIKCPQYQR